MHEIHLGRNTTVPRSPRTRDATSEKTTSLVVIVAVEDGGFDLVALVLLLMVIPLWHDRVFLPCPALITGRVHVQAARGLVGSCRPNNSWLVRIAGDCHRFRVQVIRLRVEEMRRVTAVRASHKPSRRTDLVQKALDFGTIPGRHETSQTLALLRSES